MWPWADLGFTLTWRSWRRVCSVASMSTRFARSTRIPGEGGGLVHFSGGARSIHCRWRGVGGGSVY